MTPRWYSWVKMRKNGHPWGKQTSGAKGLGLGFGGNWWFFGNFFFAFYEARNQPFSWHQGEIVELRREKNVTLEVNKRQVQTWAL